jgi:hypothetical protein
MMALGTVAWGYFVISGVVQYSGYTRKPLSDGEHAGAVLGLFAVVGLATIPYLVGMAVLGMILLLTKR